MLLGAPGSRRSTRLVDLSTAQVSETVQAGSDGGATIQQLVGVDVTPRTLGGSIK